YERRVYLEEAKRQGIRVRLPCVNRSGVEFTAEEGAIRTGLGQVFGIGEKEIAAIVERRPYASLADFIARTGLRKPSVRNLIQCGALDFTGRPRPQMMVELHAPGKPVPPLPDFTELEKFRHEFEILNLSARRHVLFYLRDGHRGFTPSCDLPELVGKRVRLIGILATLRVTETRRDERMEFLTLEDEDGIYEVTVFPDVLRNLGFKVRDIGPYIVEGKVDSSYDAVTVTANTIRPA
ncbi:MAG: helix-hairpin-helix domain-containing protein, partial [Planctomycetota bacterium]